MNKRDIFIFILWEKARRYEKEIREEISAKVRILKEVEVFWPTDAFVRHMKEFYGFGTWFTWWNKGWKCGRGPFLVLFVEDMCPSWVRRKDMRQRELLVDDRIYQLKRKLRRITGHSNVVHSSVTMEETVQQVDCLFHCSPEEAVSGERLPSAADLEQMLVANKMTLLGDGKRRVCWRIPGTALCLKSYRTDEELSSHDGTGVVRKSIAREIRLYRHDEKRNTSCLEWYYYQELRSRLPPELLAIFPERVERIHLPLYGWCIVETELKNFDGTPVRHVADELSRIAANGGGQADLCKFRALRNSLIPFFKALADAAVHFYDPPNVLVQWTSPDRFRLRIADFEPSSRTIVALDRWFAFCVSFKCRRRYGRFLRTLGLKSKW